MLNLPFPVLRLLLPERRVFVPDCYNADLWQTEKKLEGSIILSLADRAVTVKKTASRSQALLDGAPARPSLARAMPVLERSSLPVKLYCAGKPSASMVEDARSLYKKTGSSLRFVPLAAKKSHLDAMSLNLDPAGEGSVLTLLFSNESTKADSLTVSMDESILWQGFGSELPKDRRQRFTLGQGVSKIKIEAAEGGNYSKKEFTFMGSMNAKEKLLVASSRPDKKSVIEAMLPSKVISLEELKTAELYSYELLVLGGPELAKLGQDLEARLLSYVNSGAGSILFSADSPGFGIEGDSPALEQLLPMALAPRSLKKLPDLAMLLVLDVSGSMFGGKLSIAKAALAETLARLKPDDLAAVLLFSENREWLYRFGKASLARPQDQLEELKAGGGTKLYEALDEGLNSLVKVDMPLRQLILISDGIGEPASYDSIIAKAIKNGINISAMAVGDGFNRELLSLLSRASGGNLYVADSIEDIPSLVMEDRQRLSRTIFSYEKEKIINPAGIAAGSLSGMALFSPKEEGMVHFMSEGGDPLLASRSAGSRNVLLFASDLHNAYTRDFFANSFAQESFRSIMGSLLYDREPAMLISENADGIYITINSRSLAAPECMLADAMGKLYGPVSFSKSMPSWWTVSLPSVPEGPYTILLSDRGSVLARAGCWVNSGFSGREDTSEKAYEQYRTPLFCLFPASPAWLLAFFFFSLCLTLVLRTRP
ncbi:hypothetical protein MASR2M29_08440 [Spirochaetota bacterium]